MKMNAIVFVDLEGDALQLVLLIRGVNDFSSRQTWLCHALDRLDLQFTVGWEMSAITKPQRKHQATMKHCLRFMVGRRWKFDYQEWPGEIVILSDADWASDSERRRSVDCVHIYQFGHLIEASTSTQQVVSLSTAESEFYGIVRRAASGIQLRQAFMQFGFSVRLRVLSDSSAARAMTARTGSGWVKHMEARYFWVQDRVRKKRWEALTHPTTRPAWARSSTAVGACRS